MRNWGLLLALLWMPGGVSHATELAIDAAEVMKIDDGSLADARSTHRVPHTLVDEVVERYEADDGVVELGRKEDDATLDESAPQTGCAIVRSAQIPGGSSGAKVGVLVLLGVAGVLLRRKTQKRFPG